MGNVPGGTAAKEPPQQQSPGQFAQGYNPDAVARAARSGPEHLRGGAMDLDDSAHGRRVGGGHDSYRISESAGTATTSHGTHFPHSGQGAGTAGGNAQGMYSSSLPMSFPPAYGEAQHSLGGGGAEMTGGVGPGGVLPPPPPGSAGGGSVPPPDDESVPTVFRWDHGGKNVFITGTFNGWSKQIPMHRSGNDFSYIHNLKRGKHAFKFIVDDSWRYAPDQPTVADIEGRINNFIDVSTFTPFMGDVDFEDKIDSGEQIWGDSDASRGDYGGKMPDIDEYTKEPPPLPPHLRHIILNKEPQLTDTAALPVPQHVALNHLYCTAIKDNMMVLGITQRYKTKFVTTVYYSPCT